VAQAFKVGMRGEVVSANGRSRGAIAGLLGGSVAVAKAGLGLTGAGEAHLRVTADKQALDGVQDPGGGRAAGGVRLPILRVESPRRTRSQV
jgi:hypothetical protein